MVSPRLKNALHPIMTFGRDFTFVGNQFRMEVEGHEQFVDLLFFNRELNSLVAVELKTGEFKSAYLGQLHLYLQILEDQFKKPHENPPIGIILCKSADKAFVEYAVRDYDRPMGVATYRTADEMPERLRRALPPIEEMRKMLECDARYSRHQGESGEIRIPTQMRKNGRDARPAHPHGHGGWNSHTRCAEEL